MLWRGRPGTGGRQKDIRRPTLVMVGELKGDPSLTDVNAIWAEE
jgi:hypothetical protein